MKISSGLRLGSRSLSSVTNNLNGCPASVSASVSVSVSVSPRRLFHSSPINNNGSNSKGNANNVTRDTRMAGRRRFYKVVDVKPIPPPWHEFEEDTTDADATRTVDNPISAGVDGTNSATNISLQKPTRATMMKYLNVHNNHNDENQGQGQGQWYGITLDGRLMKTPLGTTLAVPSLSLAVAIASEWDAQDQTIKPAQMPLMTLTCTTLDQFAIPAVRDHTIDELLKYLRNDTTCYWADATEDRVLHRRQVKHWEKLHQWVTTPTTRSDDVEDGGGGLGSKPAVAMGSGEGLIMSRVRKSKAFAGLPHDEELMENAKRFLEGCDAWSLAAMQSVTMEAKSFLVGMAFVKGSRTRTCSSSSSGSEGSKKNPFTKDAKKAVMASRVEEEFQIENWGLVEGGHDYDRLNSSIQIHSAASLMQAIATSTSASTSTSS